VRALRPPDNPETSPLPAGTGVFAPFIPAAVLTAPPAVPVGLLAGGMVWQWRNTSKAAGAAGRHAFAPAAFDARQWHRQARSARGPLAAPVRGPSPVRTDI
jgi:hypothetical protein